MLSADEIKELVKPETLIRCVTREVSRSGARRWIRCYVCEPDRSVWLDGMIDTATAGRLAVDRSKDALRIGNPGYRTSLYIQEELKAVLGFAPKIEDL